MMDELRDRIKTFLDQHPLGILTTSGTSGAWAAPAWQFRQDLVLICLLPRWADALYYIEQDPQVLFVILDTPSDKLRWLHYRGAARRIEAPDWKRLLPEGRKPVRLDDEYAAIHITPLRVDLIDECRGWGARDTLEF